MACSDVARRELARCRNIRFEIAREVSATAWREMDRPIRRLLVTLADIPGERADARDWREFTEAEKESLGSSARYLVRQLGQVAARLW